MPGLNAGARMRFAVLADVHGNAWALQAVLTEVERHGPDGYILLGDLLADGPDPVGTLALLRALPNATFVQGNTDRYLGDLRQVVSPRSEMPDLVATWQWAVDRLGDEGCRFLADLPDIALVETPAGPVLAAHGVPGDDEDWIEPKDPAKMETLDWHGARVLLVGHSHIPFVMHGAKGMAINPGGVGISPRTGWRASYALLDLFTSGQIAVQHVQVDWDVAAYVASFEVGIPINRKAKPMLATLRQIVHHGNQLASPNDPTT